MATTITYATKVQGEANARPANEKCTYEDMNEIKTAVNEHAVNIDELQVEFLSGLFDVPIDQEYVLLINAPYAGTITNTTTKCTSGTCTATFSISGTDLGGTANSVSTTENSQAHASDNTFAAGDDIEVTVSSNSSCVKMSFNIAFTKTLT